ncbi:MAG: hypothetical protein ACI9SI_002078, partial [Polaribacter sp.]
MSQKIKRAKLFYVLSIILDFPKNLFPSNNRS